MTQGHKPHFAFIECVRGYAILLVIVCHTTYSFPELPYPVHRVTVLGWHGVQLFFLASATTLMMSWHFEKSRDGSVDVGAFFVRRFFRIAPAFYLASILYFFLLSPVGGFEPIQAAATYLFINTWSPTFMGVASDSWTVVPGSWSIGVEFTFYAVFPIFAYTVTNFMRAAILSLSMVLVGGTMNWLIRPSMEAAIGVVPTDNFLYFWFPNQMIVFALGLCLYFLLQQGRDGRSILVLHSGLIATLSLAVVACTAFLTLPHSLDLSVPLPPTFLVVTLAFMVFVLALAHGRPGLFVNRPMALFGRVSFSAYLLHWAVLKFCADQPLLGGYFHTDGWLAVPALGFALVCIVSVVLGGSWCTYRVIEVPMIGVGKSLIRWRRNGLLARV